MKKSLIAVLLLTIVLTGCAGNSKNEVKESNKENTNIENKNVENNNETENNGLPSIDLSGSEYDVVGTYDFDLDINSSTVKFTYSVNEEEGLLKYDFILDGKTFLTAGGCGANAKVYVLENTIVISYHNGCDISGTHLAAVNTDGKILFDYEYLDDNYPGMHVSYSDITISNNKIQVKANATTHGPSLLLDSEYSNVVYFCNEEEFNAANISKDYVASGTYEITYKAGKYSKPVLKDKVTVEEYINKNCSNQY